MGRRVSVGSPPIDIALRSNARARRLTLRIGRNGPVLTMPPGLREGAALVFLESQEGWLRERLSRVPQARPVEVGTSFPFEGRAVRVLAGAAPTRIEEGALVVHARDKAVPVAVAAFLKTHARRRLSEAADRHARTLGRPRGRIVLRDPGSRWGSCSSTGNLMFSWRLVMAPPPVLDYVAAHEVAHLVEFNHSRYFWRVVDDLCPDYSEHRAWLRTRGPDLHAYRFEP